MKSKSKTSNIPMWLFCFFVFLSYGYESNAAPKHNPKLFNPHNVEIPYSAYQFIHPNQRPKDTDSVERYIPQTINYGLSLALPSTVHRSMEFDAGWDKWNNSPTFRLDYFMPIRGWNDKSVFFSPRASVNNGRESFSLGAGIRHLLTSEAMIGFYAFHDWVRPGKIGGDFLRETVMGMELSALPGYFSDLKVSANAYFPTNVRESVVKDGVSLFREALPGGGDVRASFVVPPLFPYLDIRLDVQAHSYRASNTDISGHRASVSVNSRDGMLNANFHYGRDGSFGESFTVTTGINLAFDWNDLLKGQNPFSAPYKAFDKRYNRKIRDSLYSKVSRKHDLPMDRHEIKSTLMASISGDTVTFTGGFPDIPNSVVTVQVSQSPWQDCMDVSTDEKGAYYGMISLPPGTCKLRLVHKPSGRSTEPKTVMIVDNSEAQSTPTETAAWRITPEF